MKLPTLPELLPFGTLIRSRYWDEVFMVCEVRHIHGDHYEVRVREADGSVSFFKNVRMFGDGRIYSLNYGKMYCKGQRVDELTLQTMFDVSASWLAMRQRWLDKRAESERELSEEEIDSIIASAASKRAPKTIQMELAL